MAKSAIKIFIKTVLALILILLVLLILAFFYFNSTAGKRYLSSKIIETSTKTLGTQISGDIDFEFPNWISIDNLLIRDYTKDTLIFAQKTKVELDMWALKDEKLNISNFKLSDSYLNIKKIDGKFNFDDILAKLNKSETNVNQKESQLSIDLKKINLQNTIIKYTEAETKLKLKIESLKSGFEIIQLAKNKFHLIPSTLKNINITGNFKQTDSKIQDSKNPIYDLALPELELVGFNTNVNLLASNTNFKTQNLSLIAKSKNIKLDSLAIDEITVNAHKIAYKPINAIIKKSDIDDFSKVAINLKDVLVYKNSVKAYLTNASMNEDSGLEIKKTKAYVAYKNEELTLKNAATELNKSSIETDIVLNFKQKLSYHINLKSASLYASDALFFNTEIIKNEYFKKAKNDKFILSGNIIGDTKYADLQKLIIKAPNSTDINVNGKILNFSDPLLDLKITKLNTTDLDVIKWIGKLEYEIPAKIALNGTVKGKLDQLNADLKAITSLGNADININLNTNKNSPTYSGTIKTNELEIGKILKNGEIGKVNAQINFKGNDFKNPVLTFDGKVDKAIYQNKLYESISFDAKYSQKLIEGKFKIDQNGSQIDWEGIVDLNQTKPEINGKTDVKSLNLKTLGLSKEDIEVKGRFDFKKLFLDVQNPIVDIIGDNVIVIKDKVKYLLGNIKISTDQKAEAKTLKIESGFANIDVSGNFEYDKLSNLIQKEIHRYFKIPGFTPIYDDGHRNILINGIIKYDSVYKAFLPSLSYFDPIIINAKIDNLSNNAISGSIEIPNLKYDSISVANASILFNGNGDALIYEIKTDEINRDKFRIKAASISGKVKNDVAMFNLAIKDSLNQKIHALQGNAKEIENGIRVSFEDGGTLLSYQPWSGNPYGYFDYTTKGIYFNDVIFTSGEQIFRINSLTSEPNGPLRVFTENIDLNFLAKTFIRDSTLVKGSLDTDIELFDYMGNNPSFTGEYGIEGLYYKEKPLGKLYGNANSESAELINIQSFLTGEYAEVEIRGDFKPNKKDQLDFNAIVKKFDAKTLSIWTENIAKDLNGNIKADLKINGGIENPKISGSATMEALDLSLIETGAKIKITDQKMTFENGKVLFKDFVINDINFNSIKANGQIDINKLPDYTYSFNFKGQDFKIIDAAEGQNELYYGEGLVDTDLNIKGKNLDFKCTGDVVLKPKSNLTLLTDSESEIGTEMLQIINFVGQNDSLNKNKEEENSKINFANAVNINLEINKAATINLLMNQVTGDIMTVNGAGKLNVGFDNKGEAYVIGRYDIVNGKYDMTYYVIPKEFAIKETSQSYISWTGSPLNAEISINAEYTVPGKKSLAKYPFANLDPSEKNKLDALKPVPLRVDMSLKGLLMQPTVTFDLVVNETDIYGIKDPIQKAGFKILDRKGEANTSKLSAATKTEINNQSVLMLMNLPFSSSSSVSNQSNSTVEKAESIARQKASEIISNELNKLTSDLIKGIDVNVGVVSEMSKTSQDAVLQKNRNTNLSIGLSKKLANERLILQVGKNFELENKAVRSDEIFDNLQADWLITKDGRYRFNMFRKNRNELVVEGNVIETGLGFVIAIDYETWKDLVRKQK